jgi:uncharacterized protein YndB with AHSA1/START domain
MTTTTRNAVTTQIYRVYIRSTPQAIWDAITRPEWSEQYNYSARVDYDLRPGGAFKTTPSAAARARATAQGFEMPEVMVDGEVLEADPPRKLVQTWRMVMDETMAAEGFTHVTWEIEPIDDTVTKLTVTHDLEGAPVLAVMVGGGRESEGAGGGWNEVLSGLKTLLETSEPLRPFVFAE